ncbi:MAG: LptF/LptG family permease [Pyrinomonadaceae bacterium]|nr:LptF/LptG family permease [Pyrinomonadaceae bacterium]
MIERYLWRTIAPYFFISWSLLTIVIFLQQGSRFGEILIGTQIPLKLVLRLSAAIVLTVIAFTGPMALMVGVLLGLGQLRGDSELTIFEAAGISRWRILAPCLILGFAVCIFSLAINIYGVPWASQTLRRVAVEAAILKLESPIEPGTFNTNIGNYVIYVDGGDNEKGYWEKVFLTSTEPNGNMRLITSKNGRIDSGSEKSELVLSDAVVTTLPRTDAASQSEITTEQVATLRVTLETGRRELLKKLQNAERQPDEMGLAELARYSNGKIGKERNEAEVLWYRRVTLSIAPLLLAIAAVSLSLRFGRGGRSGAGALALSAIVAYYLLSLLGEQLVRGGVVIPIIGCWLATFTTLAFSLWWWFGAMRLGSLRNSLLKLFKGQTRSDSGFNDDKTSINVDGTVYYDENSVNVNLEKSKPEKINLTGINRRKLFGVPEIGLLELDLVGFTTRFLFLVIGGLWLLFLIFTTFEILRFAALTTGGGILLLKYLIFFTPLVLWQVAPVGMMLAVLVTFAIKSRQSEIVIWEASGFGKFRLMLPVLLYSLLIGFAAWSVQEQILPRTNLWQDNLRAQLRGEGSVGRKENRLWVKTINGICSFVVSNEAAKNPDGGSQVDFKPPNAGNAGNNLNGRNGGKGESAKDVFFYNFNADGIHLKRITYADDAFWSDGSMQLNGDVKQIDWLNTFVERKNFEKVTIAANDGFNPFSQVEDKLSHLDTGEILNRLNNVESRSEERRLTVAWNKRYATIFQPIVQVMLCLPFAFWFRGKGVTKALATVLGVWMFFVLISTAFERLGSEGFLSPMLAVWSPLVIFAGLGSYWLTKNNRR